MKFRNLDTYQAQCAAGSILIASNKNFSAISRLPSWWWVNPSTFKNRAYYNKVSAVSVFILLWMNLTFIYHKYYCLQISALRNQSNNKTYEV